MASMSSEKPVLPDGPPVQPWAAWARRWNELWPQAQGERGPPRLSSAQQEHLEQLYMLVADDLRRLAATPRHRWLGDSIQDRAYVLYWCLIIGLITRNGSLDPEGNIQALMVKIATNRSIDLFRTERRHVAHQVPLTEDQAPPGGDTDLETHVADHSHEAAVIAATFAYWASLPWPDGEIMRLRHATNSTNLRPFVSIAAHLGPRHKPNTVQHIYYRTLERTREHLRSLGLLDDEGAD